MSLHRLWAILRKEFRHIWRDKRTLFLVTLSPAIMLLTFSYLFAMEVQKSRVGVWDADQSALSREFIASLSADGKFVVAATPRDYATMREALTRGDIDMGLVIPPSFEEKLAAGQQAPIQVVADGSDAITSVQSVARFRERAVEFEKQHARLETGLLITVQAQAWYNRELDSMFAMVPGLIPIVMILPSLAIALAITREKELGSFETLVATPIRALEYLLGKIIPYITYGLISASVVFLVAVAWFHVPLRGSVGDLIVLTLAYLIASLGESLFLASFLTSQGTAMRIILLLFFVPSFFLSGVILPVDTQAGPGAVYSSLLPTRYFVQITRGVFLKGLGVADLAAPALYLLLLGLVPFILSWSLFRKQVD
jgi:ABC-2 type transport system permease protein